MRWSCSTCWTRSRAWCRPLNQRAADCGGLGSYRGYLVSGDLSDICYLILLRYLIFFLHLRKIDRNPPQVQTPPIHHPLVEAERGTAVFAQVHVTLVRARATGRRGLSQRPSANYLVPIPVPRPAPLRDIIRRRVAPRAKRRDSAGAEVQPYLPASVDGLLPSVLIGVGRGGGQGQGRRKGRCS